MKYVVKMVVIMMGILLVGCGTVGPDGKIYLTIVTMGTNSLEVTGEETSCLAGYCTLDGSVTVEGETLDGYVLHSGNIEYSYTYDTYVDSDEDGDLSNDTATASGAYTVTPNKGGDASGFDDGTGGYDKASLENGFKIVDIPGKGKGVVAVRNFKRGDIIFAEKPVIHTSR